MKNEEAWAYVKKVADWYGAVDSESVAQDVLVKKWDEDLPKAYWAACARNGARRQYRDETKHIRLREILTTLPERDVAETDFDSRLMLEGLRECEPCALDTVLHFIFDDKKFRHTNVEYKAVDKARKKLRQWAYA